MGRHLLLWDAPNIDMTLSNIIDGKPTASERPDLAVLGRWLVAQAAPGDRVEGCVFINVAPQVAGPLRGWVQWLLQAGYRVFAKPKDGDSDVDDDMIDHLHVRHAEGDLDAVYVGSNDARAFSEPLSALATTGVRAVVLGFAEFAGDLPTTDGVHFVDLEDVPGLFEQALPRLNLATLPADGRWFEPSGALGA